jgi:hypothetical protein
LFLCVSSLFSFLEYKYTGASTRSSSIFILIVLHIFCHILAQLCVLSKWMKQQRKKLWRILSFSPISRQGFRSHYSSQG